MLAGFHYNARRETYPGSGSALAFFPPSFFFGGMATSYCEVSLASSLAHSTLSDGGLPAVATEFKISLMAISKAVRELVFPNLSET